MMDLESFRSALILIFVPNDVRILRACIIASTPRSKSLMESLFATFEISPHSIYSYFNRGHTRQVRTTYPTHLHVDHTRIYLRVLISVQPPVAKRLWKTKELGYYDAAATVSHDEADYRA